MKKNRRDLLWSRECGLHKRVYEPFGPRELLSPDTRICRVCLHVARVKVKLAVAEFKRAHPSSNIHHKRSWEIAA